MVGAQSVVALDSSGSASRDAPEGDKLRDAREDVEGTGWATVSRVGSLFVSEADTSFGRRALRL